MNEFLWPVRVYYEDTDAGGVVYYANYLKFMERARTEWLRELGFEQDALRNEDGIIFAVRAVQIDYLKPARFNDLLQVSVRTLRAGKASVTLAQSVARDGQGDALCTATVKLASLDVQTLRPKAVPAAVEQAIAATLGAGARDVLPKAIDSLGE